MTKDWIVSEAKRTFDDPNFQASRGWFFNFKNRWNVKRRVATHVIQKLSEDYANQTIRFMEEIRRLRFDYEEKGVSLVIGNMDETSLKFCMDSGMTYDFGGNKEIIVRMCKGNKLTFTVMLAILSDGAKLPPLIIFKSGNPVSETLRKKYRDRVLLFNNTNGWCTEYIMSNWLNLIWLNLNITPTDKLLLVCDRFSAHTKDTIQDKLKTGESENQIYPSWSNGPFTTP